ncbi:CD63 antigen-like [Lineus longissimus]|uniref:CD63 antigen-like n=1 Tax=Lineus longissimus TaxID=88925 RepID=UPI002B4CBD35
MVEGGMKCVKYLLFAFNFLFFLAGLALIIAGAVIEIKFKEYVEFFGTSFSSVAILLIVVGCIIFIIGFFGCCGAVKENYCMVMTFSVLLSVIFIIEIAAGIAAFVMRKDLQTVVDKQMKIAMTNYNTSTGVKKTWDTTQQTFKCCGVTSTADWVKDGPFKGKTPPYPQSCCKDSDCTKNKEPFNKPCLMEIKDWLERNIYAVAGVGIGLAFVQIIGVIFSCCLARSIKKEYEVV